MPIDLSRFAVRLEETGNANDRVDLQQKKRVGRIVQIHLAGLDGRGDLLRYRIHVDFESELKRLFGADAAAHSAELFPFNRLVKLKLPAPEILAAKSVEAENLPTILQQVVRIAVAGITEGLPSTFGPTSGFR